MSESLVMKLATELDKWWVSKDLFGNDTPFSRNSTWLEQMFKVPEANISRMLEMDYSNPKLKTVSDVYQAWGQGEMLLFEPYVDTEDGIPTLVLRHDQYLQFPADSFFSISSTMFNASYESMNSIDITGLTCFVKSNVCTGKMREAVKLLFWCAVVDTGFYSKPFYKYFREGYSPIATWLTSAVVDRAVNMSFDFLNVLDYLSWSTTRPDYLDEFNKYAFRNKKGLYCILYYKGCKFVCEVRRGLCPIYLVFDVSRLKDELGSLQEYLSVDKLLITAALNFAGIHSTWYQWYKIDPLLPITIPNYSDVQEVSSLVQVFR